MKRPCWRRSQRPSAERAWAPRRLSRKSVAGERTAACPNCRQRCGGDCRGGGGWTANRSEAPDAFVVELERALQLIAVHPGIGARATNVWLEGVRRIHLARGRYHLYYRVAGASETIEVLALWHAGRGSSPKIE